MSIINSIIRAKRLVTGRVVRNNIERTGESTKQLKMQKAEHLIFTYGTLKRGQPNHAWLQKSEGFKEYIGTAKTFEKFPLVIATKFYIPFMLNAPGKGENVTGEVYRVDDVTLASLDVVECHPHLYEQTQVGVLMTENAAGQPVTSTDPVSCISYVIHKYRSQLLKLPFMSVFDVKSPSAIYFVPREERIDTFKSVWGQIHTDYPE